MRTLFIPLAKLLGIYAVFQASSYILLTITQAISIGKFIDSGVISYLIYSLCLMLGLILIFKTERVADVLKMPQDKTDSLIFDFHSMLRVGLVLIGVNVLIYAIPTFLGSIVGPVFYTRRPYTVEVFPPLIRIVFGGCLVLLSNRLAGFLSKSKEQTQL